MIVNDYKIKYEKKGTNDAFLVHFCLNIAKCRFSHDVAHI